MRQKGSFMFQLEVLENNIDEVNGSLLTIQSYQNGTQGQLELLTMDLESMNQTVYVIETNVAQAEKQSLDNSYEIIFLESRINTLRSRISTAEQRITDLESP